MTAEPVPEVHSIDESQWEPDDYDLLYHFANFAWMANCVVTEPGPLQGWFSEPCHRCHSYVPFNLRVQENYYSLAFFLAHQAPWNIYRQHPGVRERLHLTLRYTFELMGEEGAISEIDEVPSAALAGDRIVAAGGFGVEHMAGVLDVAGDLLSKELRRDLIEQARKAAMLVLSSDTCQSHASSVTNQYTGALVGALKLARLTKDDELRQVAERGSEHLLADFMSPLGYLYEADGADTFGYPLHTTLSRIIALYHEWPDPRFLEVLRRHCEWMTRWLLLEPDGHALIHSSSHLTRTSPDYRARKWRPRGIERLLVGPEVHDHAFGDLRPDGADERRFLKLLLETKEDELEQVRRWESEPDPVGVCRERCLREGYRAGPLLNRYELYAPSQAELPELRSNLPCQDQTPRTEVLRDDRGNQYVLARRPSYYLGFAFTERRAPSAARQGPSFLWLDRAGALILSENGDRACWQTVSNDGTRDTATMPALAEVRDEGHEVGVTVRYEVLGVRKTYVLGERSIIVGLYDITGTWQCDLLSECIPLLLREDDVVNVGYGRWRNCVGGKLCCYTDRVEIERAGAVLVSIGLQTKTQIWFRTTFDPDGYMRVKMTFPLAPGFYGKYGYRIDIGDDRS